jgi:hypothetical protein
MPKVIKNPRDILLDYVILGLKTNTSP